MIILNKHKEISDCIKEKILYYDEIYIAVAFITNIAIREFLTPEVLKNKKIKIITTTEQCITEYKTLQFFLDNNIDTKIINKGQKNRDGNILRSFHSKFIIFKKNDEKEAMIGSFNITNNAIYNKLETVIFIKNPKNIEDQFEFLFNYGHSLTQNFIDEYLNISKNWNNFKNEFKYDFLLDGNFNPNEMQIPVLEELNILRSKNERKALLWSATGTGKTFLSAFDIKQTKSKKILFIVHNRVIIRSAKRDFSSIFPNKRIMEAFTDNIEQIKFNDFIFTTQQTIKKALENGKITPDIFDYIIFDEAHRIGPNNLQGYVFNKFEKESSAFILGMTATPIRGDNERFVFDIFRNIVGKIDMLEARKRKLISKMNYLSFDTDFSLKGESLTDENIIRMVNGAIEKLNKYDVWDKSKIKGLIFTEKIVTARKISKIMNEKGYISESVTSQDNTEKDQLSHLIDHLQDEQSDLNFLVTVDKFNEGVDIPLLNTIIMMRPTESSIIYIQQIGRGLRKDINNEKILNLIDLVGNHNNNYEKLSIFSGGTNVNPKESLASFVLKEWNNDLIVNFDITEIAEEKILRNISSLTERGYFESILTEVQITDKTSITLNNIEDFLHNSISKISNSFRTNVTLNKNDRPWIINMINSYSKNKINVENSDEESIIEMFSWMPITTSTPEEKKDILSLMQGNEVILDNKWISYFLGVNVWMKNESRCAYIKGEFFNWFLHRGNKIMLIKNIENKRLIKIFDQIKKYLKDHIEINNYLKIGVFYSSAEISFMADLLDIPVSGKFTRYSKSKRWDPEEKFLLNKCVKKKPLLTDYLNELISIDEVIFSDDKRRNGFKNKEKLHLFLGSSLFNMGKYMYQYLGKPEKIDFEDTRVSDGKEYDRYKMKIKPIKEIDRIYFQIYQNNI